MQVKIVAGKEKWEDLQNNGILEFSFWTPLHSASYGEAV
jgi:hypothetical protein